jgi:PilZ domain
VTPKLAPGDPVTVSFPEVPDGPRLRGRVRESEGGRLITLRASECPFKVGDVLRLDVVVPGDARYMLEARLRSYRDRVLVLDPRTDWQRTQRREYYRVRTGAIPVQVLRDLEHRTERDAKYKSYLYDLSGGGAQLESDVSFEEDEQVVLKFRLEPIQLAHVLAVVVEEEPDLAPVEVEVRARIVRVVKISAGRRRRVGTRFSGLGPVLRRRLLRWIYASQSQRRAREMDNLIEV